VGVAIVLAGAVVAVAADRLVRCQMQIEKRRLREGV
jgi:hypothetical protein